MERALETLTRDLEARLDAALADLADGCPRPSDIAAKLAAAGCKGVRRGCCSCPVAVWLARQLGLPDDLLVNVGVDLAWIEAGDNPGDEVACAVVPPVVAIFVGIFDQDSRGFPELEAAS